MNNEMNFDDILFDEQALLNEINLNNNSNNTLKNNLTGPYDGYMKGNLYKKLYSQYKNYKPAKLVPNNEQAELLLNINQTSFAAHDIRLYLDNNPNDKNMIQLFNMYQQQANEATKEYERRYGPILMDTLSNPNQFSWEEYSWPWEMGDR